MRPEVVDFGLAFGLQQLGRDHAAWGHCAVVCSSCSTAWGVISQSGLSSRAKGGCTCVSARLLAAPKSRFCGKAST